MISIDETFLDEQRRWSLWTFGPGRRTQGLVEHIKKELDEVLEQPRDLSEWIDVAILAFDGAWRAGYSPMEIIIAYRSKMQTNFDRNWPDWRTFTEGQAIEHLDPDPLD